LKAGRGALDADVGGAGGSENGSVGSARLHGLDGDVGDVNMSYTLEFPQNGLRIRWVVGSGAVFWVKQEWNWD